MTTPEVSATASESNVARETTNTPEPQAEQAAQAEAKKWKLEDLDDPKKLSEFLKGKRIYGKVNGKDTEAQFEEMQAKWSREDSSEKRYQAAAEAKKAIEAEKQAIAAMRREVEEFNADPLAFLKKMGNKGHDIAEKLLLEKIAYDQMSPEQKALEEERRRRVEYEKKLQEVEEREKKNRATAMEAQVAREIDEEITDAIKTSGLAPTRELVALIAANMLTRAEATGERIEAAKAVQTTRAMVESAAKSYISSLTPEQIRAILPKNLLDGLRKEDVKAALAQDPIRRSRKEQSSAKTPPVPVARRPVTTDDVFSQLEQRYRR